MGMFSGHKTVFCGIDPFFFLIVEYSLLDLVIYCYPLNKVQECIEHFLKWLNLKGSFQKNHKTNLFNQEKPLFGVFSSDVQAH